MKDNAAFKGFIAIVVLAILVGGVIVINQEDEVATDTQTQTSSDERNSESSLPVSQQPVNDTEQMDQENTSEAQSAYQDGSYTASGSYSSPGGVESIEVTVNLEGDEIASVSVTSQAKHPTSKQFQASFINGIAELVTGVSLDQADVDIVSGSSLTSGGFNEALDAIKQQATI